MKDPAEILKEVVEAMWPDGKVDCNAARVDARIAEVLIANGLAPAWVYRSRGALLHDPDCPICNPSILGQETDK